MHLSSRLVLPAALLIFSTPFATAYQVGVHTTENCKGGALHLNEALHKGGCVNSQGAHSISYNGHADKKAFALCIYSSMENCEHDVFEDDVSLLELRS